MADEAVVRIVLQDDGGKPARGDVAPKPPAPTTPVPTKAPAPNTPAPAPRDWVRDLIQGIEGANRHVLIEGQSGSGKSMMTRHLAFQRMEQGEDVHVVDTHNPEFWKGAKQVFQGETAGKDAAKFMYDLLAERKKEAQEAKSKGELPQFKDVTVVLSDFARLMRDTPQLRDEFKTLLTEARKFRISIVADTTALTGASSGIKGINDVLNNFAQKVKLFAPATAGGERTAKLGGETFKTPLLPGYQDRVDLSLVKPTAETANDLPVGAAATARRQMERDRYAEQVRQERLKTDPEFRAREEEKAQRKKEAEDRKRQAEIDRTIRELERQARREEREENQKRRAQEKADRDFAKAEREWERGQQKLILAERAEKKKDDRIQAEIDRDFAKEEKDRKAKEKRAKEAKENGPLEALDSLRGTIGGLFGTTVGGLFDAGIAFKRAQQQRAAQAAAGGAPGPGGIIGAATSAAPYVAAALAVDQAVKGAVKGAVQGVGGFLLGAASTDQSPGNAISKVGGAISSFGDKIPVIGAAISALGEAGKILGGLMESFSKRAEQYAEYNPLIAQARAMAEIQTTLGDMRRAMASGPELARFVQENAKLQQQFEEVKAKIWQKILPVLINIMRAIMSLVGIAENQQDNDLMMDPTEIMLRGPFSPEL